MSNTLNKILLNADEDKPLLKKIAKPIYGVNAPVFTGMKLVE